MILEITPSDTAAKVREPTLCKCCLKKVADVTLFMNRKDVYQRKTVLLWGNYFIKI
jgi:hypothetical protein